jgi:4-amino-4-deoxy-L-arabinose transferase-like glycosyltransferase
VAALVFVLLWPAMWVDPLGSLSRVFSLASTYASEGHDTPLFFNGIIYDSGQSAWYYYPVAYLWRATPVTLLGLGLALFALIAPRHLPLNMQRRRLAVALLLFTALFGLFISLSEKKFERYLLPVFPALDLVAALGWIGLVDALRGLAGRWLGPGLAAVIILAQAFGVFQTYPYYLDYYNPLLGGAKNAPEVMMIGWGEGLDQAGRILNTLPGKGRVVSWYGEAVVFLQWLLGIIGPEFKPG